MPSRQYRYQLRKKAQGLCTICGQRPLHTKHHCKICAIKTTTRKATEKYRRKARLFGQKKHGYKPWRPGGVGRPPIAWVTGDF